MGLNILQTASLGHVLWMIFYTLKRHEVVMNSDDMLKSFNVAMPPQEHITLHLSEERTSASGEKSHREAVSLLSATRC